MNICEICFSEFVPNKWHPKQRCCSIKCRRKTERSKITRLKARKRYESTEKGKAKVKKHAKNVYNSLKLKCFELLGNKCACPKCPETNLAFLSVDHIDPKVKEPDSKRLTGNELWRYIIGILDRSNYQLLCMNCNFVKRDKINYLCPHMTQKREIIWDLELVIFWDQ